MTISPDRSSEQRIILLTGRTITGKNVRRISRSRFISLGGNGDARTFGDVRFNGREIPVVRRRGRNVWQQAGAGLPYSA